MTLPRLSSWPPAARRWELAFTMAVVCLAVAIPTAGLLYFMNRVMNAEGERMHMALTASRQSAVEKVRATLSQLLHDRLKLAAAVAGGEESFYQKFRNIIQQEAVAGCLILDPQGRVQFPVLTVPAPEADVAGPDVEAATLLENQVAESITSGQPPTVEKHLQAVQALGHQRLRGIASGSGRGRWPQALLGALHEMPPSHPRRAELLAALKSRVEDYAAPLPSAQRHFLAAELVQLGVQPVLPDAAAEAFSLKMANTCALPQESETLVAGPPAPDHFAVRLKSVHAVLYLHRDALLDSLTDTAGQLLSAEGLTAMILPHGQSSGGPALASIAVGSVLPGWDIRAYGPDASAAIAGRIRGMKRIYVGSAITGSLLIGALAAWAIRRFALRARETRIRQDFLSLVSHELKTPLTSIRMFVDSLDAGGLEEPERARTYLDFIRRENERLSRLVENFLTFSRIESGRMIFDFHIVHPDDVAAAVGEAVASRVGLPGCQFEISGDPDLPLVKADPGSLVTALVNLVDNALKYTRDAKEILLSITTDGSSVVFAVTDNGIGMSEETRRRLGEKFYRDRNAAASGQKGFGLGLNIVRSIVAAHGGTLGNTTSPGAGSRFTITLPAQKEEQL